MTCYSSVTFRRRTASMFPSPPSSAHHATRRVRLRRTLAITVAGVLMSTPLAAGPASAQRKSTSPERRRIAELESQRAKVRAEKARKAMQVNALKASDDEVQKALDHVSAEIDGQTASLADAERAQSQAESDLAAADAAVSTARDELAGLKVSMKQQAIAAYVNVPSEAQWSVLTAADALTATTKDTFLSASTNKNLDAVERYRALQEDLALALDRSTAAAARAKQHQSEVRQHLDELQRSQTQQQQLADQVADRIANSESEAASLAALDGQLSGQLSAAQSALSAKLAAQQRAAAAARAALTKAGRKVSSPDRANPPGGVDIPARAVGSGNLATVRGITVDASIADNLSRLLAAADAAGISLSGGGYRDPASQIATRRNNCGSSNYAIYEAPASSCRPPTARPGSSMHERGLAIDFTSGGRVLSRGSAAYGWLKANASAYGFYNLPSEAWHWSTNGN